MPHAVKVAISLPPAIFESVEEARRQRQESRSEFFRQAVRAFLRSLQEKAAVERYVRGYQEQPESPEEVGEIGSVSHIALAEEPWD
jgi:metal-responsive CopG/Arc/MetJ family transcriptional regulator